MMSFNWDLRVPFRYQNSYVTLRRIEGVLLEYYHPEYVRRVLAWFHFHNGYVGLGGDWRDDGTQKDAPGFAPEGQSFHQNQEYADGWIGPSAIDVVVRDGPDAGDWHDGIPWSAVPVQGSAEADRWGLHANVGVPGKSGSEAWHIQWADAHIGGYDLDGWGSWINAGSPAIIPNYPIPTEHDPYKDDEMTPFYFTTRPSPAPLWVVEAGKDGTFAVHVSPAEWNRRGNPTGAVISKAAAGKYTYCTPVGRDLVTF
jgi:hypothetical protein